MTLSKILKKFIGNIVCLFDDAFVIPNGKDRADRFLSGLLYALILINTTLEKEINHKEKINQNIGRKFSHLQLTMI